MAVTNDFLKELNTVYDQLEEKQKNIQVSLAHLPYRIRTGWFNGHYHKNEEGEWTRSAYPIPEVDLIDLCDIEIHLDRILITTKMKREAALEYPLDRLMEYEFEAYGVIDYLADYYRPGQTIQKFRENVEKSAETDIGFSFVFPVSTDGTNLLAFVKLLESEGFYY